MPTQIQLQSEFLEKFYISKTQENLINEIFQNIFKK